MDMNEFMIQIQNVFDNSMQRFKVELKQELKYELKKELKQELVQEMRLMTNELRDELKQDIKELREEINGIHEEINGIHEEINGIHEEINKLREEMKIMWNDIDKLYFKVEYEIDEKLNLIIEYIEIQKAKNQDNNNKFKKQDKRIELNELKIMDHDIRIEKLEKIK